MSYSEENGQVVLRMSREDHEMLLRVFAGATAYAIRHGNFFRDDPFDGIVDLLDRLNSGNPNYTQVEPDVRKP